MHAVWSLWTPPLTGGHHPGWYSPHHHLLSWVLSFNLARRHFASTCLITDSAGAAVLVDGLGLRFDEVSTELDILAGLDPDWWAIAKLYAIRAQDSPFLHLDNDVFLWRALPESLLTAPVFAEHPESAAYGACAYQPERIEHDVVSQGGWMPEEFAQHIPFGGRLIAPNCGIIGGTHIPFLQYFAGQALRFIEHPDNQPIWRRRGRMDGDAIVFEQMLLSACLAFHAGRPDSPYADVRIDYLFDSTADACARGEAVGYTHLVSDAKRNAGLAAALERIVARDYPEAYARACALTGGVPAAATVT